jgi:hypothetical protein
MPHLAPTINEIRAKACAAAFGNAVVENSFRGFVVEIIVDAALAPGWLLCSGDWRGWDFEHTIGARLEVKQSAARQTWTTPPKPPPPIFDIRERTEYRSAIGSARGELAPVTAPAVSWPLRFLI